MSSSFSETLGDAVAALTMLTPTKKAAVISSSDWPLPAQCLKSRGTHRGDEATSDGRRAGFYARATRATGAAPLFAVYSFASKPEPVRDQLAHGGRAVYIKAIGQPDLRPSPRFNKRLLFL